MAKLVRRRAAADNLSPPIATTSNIPKLRIKKTAEGTTPNDSGPRSLEPPVLFVPGLPPDDGPPPLANGMGVKVLSDESGEITLTLDNGAFRWLWDTAEANALRHYRQYRTLPSVDAGKRALTAIRNAGHHQYRPPEGSMPKNHRPYPSPRVLGTEPPPTPKRLRRKPS